jgi:hypothetical protein
MICDVCGEDESPGPICWRDKCKEIYALEILASRVCGRRIDMVAVLQDIECAMKIETEKGKDE